MKNPFRGRDVRPFLILCALVAIVWFRHHPRPTATVGQGNLVALDQVQDLFPEAASLVPLADEPGDTVMDGAGNTLGMVLVSGPDTARVTGYGGPTPVAIGLDADHEVMGVLLLDNMESESYLQEVVDTGLLESWNGLSATAALSKPVDAVSGATMSSSSIIETVRLTLQPLVAEAQVVRSTPRITGAVVAVWLVLLFDLALFFFAKRLHRLRPWILAANVAVTGFYAASLLSLAQFAGWSLHGIPVRAWLTTGVMLVLAILLPFFTGRDFYCACVCPYGSFQELLGRWRRPGLHTPPWLGSFLHGLRALVLGLAWLGMVAGLALDFTTAEPFAAFHWQAAGGRVLVLAGIFLALSFFVPRVWCRFLCPTGRLLTTARCAPQSSGTRVSFAGYSLCLVLVAASWLAWNSAYVPAKQARDVLQVIHSRCSVRNYTSEPVTQNQLDTLLRAAMAAPTAGNAQPWSFVVVTDREQLSKLAGRLEYGKMLTKAGAAIVVCGLPEQALPGEARGMWVLDCAVASENILLAAEGIGLGGVWVGVYPIEERMTAVREVLGLPENVVPLNVISLGHPTGIERPKRKFDEKKIHHETW